MKIMSNFWFSSQKILIKVFISLYNVSLFCIDNNNTTNFKFY